MEAALSRIEREFVIKSLIEDNPELLLVCGSACLAIPSDDYRLQDDCLTILNSLDVPLHSPVRVYFSHRQRGFYFDSVHTRGPIGTSSQLRIGEHLYKEPQARSGGSEPVLYLENPLAQAIARPSEGFPLEHVFPDPTLYGERREHIEILADKLGFKDFQFHAARIFEYLSQRLGAGELPASNQTGVLIFADENALGFTISKEAARQWKEGDELRFALVYGNRRVRFSAICAGLTSLDRLTTIFTARISDMQEEDRRFLHERVYSSRYQ